jgi:protein-tyrosine-phosphatase
MAQQITEHLLKEKGIKDIEVSSCGIYAAEGQPMSENAQKALKNIGITPCEHKSKPFKEEFFEQYNLILTMTKEQKELLENRKNVFTIGELTGVNDISDPYGLSVENYSITASQLLYACNILLDTIK